MIRIGIGLFLLLWAFPYTALTIGDHFQSEIAQSSTSAKPWRRARLSYRIAQFSPLFWKQTQQREQETDLILSDQFFRQVLRGEQDAIIPQNHLDFLADRPETPEWNDIEWRALLRYGEFSEVLSQSRNPQINTVAAFFIGDTALLEENCNKWQECPKTWLHQLPWQETTITESLTQVPLDFVEESLQPLFAEWLITQKIENATWNQEIINHQTGHTDGYPQWFCAQMALYNHQQNPQGIQESLHNIALNDLLLTYGNMTQSAICAPARFEDALEMVDLEPSALIKLRLLIAHSYLTQLQVSPAQKSLKALDDLVDLSQEEQRIRLHLRVLARELAGDPIGMVKYAEQGLEYDKVLFTIHIAKAKLYLQEKVTALQKLSSLNGYPIEEKMQNAYTEMLLLSKNLNGSATTMTIGNSELTSDFFNHDEDFREWIVKYAAAQMDQPTSDPLNLILLRYWRGEDKHATQLLDTHLEEMVSPTGVMLSVHQNFLHASLQNRKQLINQTWKSFSQTRNWLSQMPLPQMLHTHPELFSTPFPK